MYTYMHKIFTVDFAMKPLQTNKESLQAQFK